MKKLFTLLFISGKIIFTSAQTCTPDPQYVSQGPGVYPDSIVGLPPAYTCQSYNAVITVVVPYDTVYNGQYMLIDSAVLTGVTDMPPNLFYACSPSGCSFPGGTSGCIVLFGIPNPTDTGQYIPVGTVMGYVSAFPGAAIPFAKIDYYKINIIPGGGPVNANIATDSAISCYGNCDGSLKAMTNCGFPPYSYLWSNGQTSQTAAGLCAGAYSVTVNDSASSVVANYSLSQPAALSLNILQANPTNGCNGSIFVNPSGGTAPYTYLWTTGQTSQGVSSLCNGPYQVTVTDARGCQVINAVFLTGISELSQNDNIRIFPNPGDGKFWLQITDLNGFTDYRLQIYNILAQRVYSSSVIRHPSSDFDLSFLPNGQYIVQVFSKEKIYSQKIVISKF